MMPLDLEDFGDFGEYETFMDDWKRAMKRLRAERLQADIRRLKERGITINIHGREMPLNIPEYGPLQRPTQTDAEAANSANPDTERLPAPDDPGWDQYLFATSSDYRVEWYQDHGDDEAAQEEMDAERDRRIEDGTWSDSDEDDYIEGGWADDEGDGD